VADALKAQGLLEDRRAVHDGGPDAGRPRTTSTRLAATVNAPPLDVKGLREEWAPSRKRRALPRASLPSLESITALWADLKAESRAQERSIFETSSVMACQPRGRLPGGMRWLSTSARVGAARTGQVFAAALLDHYRRR